MRFQKINGQMVSWSLEKHRIDWDGESLSKSQKQVKAFLRPFWERLAVYEEAMLPGTKLRLDFFCKSRMIAIEFDGIQHDKYNKFFMNDNRSNYIKQRMRDEKKNELCQLNEIILLRFKPSDLKIMSKSWVRDKWGIEI